MSTMSQKRIDSFFGQSQGGTLQPVKELNRRTSPKLVERPTKKFRTPACTVDLTKSESDEETQIDSPVDQESPSARRILTPRRGKYKSYSLSEKKEAVQLSYEHGTTAIERRLKIAHSTLMTWRRGLSEESPKVRRDLKSGRKTGSGRKLSYGDEVDQKILAWVQDQKHLQLPVSRQRVQLYARQTVADRDFRDPMGG